MGVIVNKEQEDNSNLSKRISADLKERNAKAMDSNDIDLANDAEYLKNLNTTSKFGWVWIVLIILAILSLISIIFF